MSPVSPSIDDDWEDVKKVQKRQRKKSGGPRTLKRWNPGEDQNLLILIENICFKQGVPIDWDAIGQEMTPSVSGEAIKQHIGKLAKARETAGLSVPSKPDKGTRRKSGKTGNAVMVTPTKTGRAKKSAVAEDEEDRPAPGSNLLWKPAPKKVKTPKTPGTGRGGEKNPRDEDGDSKTFGKPTPSTKKRGRKPKKEIKKEEVDEDSEYADTPVKKPKMTTQPKRAAAKKANYKEDPVSDDDAFGGDNVIVQHEGDDGDDVEDVPQALWSGGIVKGDFRSSQDSTSYRMPQDQSMSMYEPHMIRSFPASQGDPNFLHGDGNWNPLMPNVHGSFGGPPHLYQPQITAEHRGQYNQPPGMHMGGYGGSNHMQSDNKYANAYGHNHGNMAYGGYGGVAFGYQGDGTMPTQEQTEDRSSRNSPAMQDGYTDNTVAKKKPKPKAPRKSISPKQARTPKRGSPVKKTGNKGQAYRSVSKVESEMPGLSDAVDYKANDDFVAGMMSTHDTGYGDQMQVQSGAADYDTNEDFAGHMSATNDMGYAYGMNQPQYGGDTQLHLQTEFDAALDMPTTVSPDDIVNDWFTPRAMGGENQGVTNWMANNAPVNNPMLSQSNSHNSSFVSSIQGSQTLQGCSAADTGDHSFQSYDDNSATGHDNVGHEHTNIFSDLINDEEIDRFIIDGS